MKAPQESGPAAASARTAASRARAQTPDHAAPALPDRRTAASRLAQLSALANPRRPAIQLKTTLTWNPQNMTVAKYKKLPGFSGDVGGTAHAKIDPTDPIVGHETTSREYPTLYDNLYARYNTTFIRGHLLNADFGGSNVAANLFPITSKANSLHKSHVENHVKGWIKDAQTKSIDYTVNAVKGHNEVEDAQFHCVAKRTNKKGKVDKTVDRTITSSPHAYWYTGASTHAKGDTEGWAYPGISNVWKWFKSSDWLHEGGLGSKQIAAIDALGSPLTRTSGGGHNHGYQ